MIDLAICIDIWPRQQFLMCFVTLAGSLEFGGFLYVDHIRFHPCHLYIRAYTDALILKCNCFVMMRRNYSKYKALTLIQDRTGGLEKKELPSFYAMPSALPTVAYYM